MKTNIKFVSKYKVEGVEQYSPLEEVAQWLSAAPIIGIDIETSRKYKRGVYDESVYKGGLDPYLSRVVMLQMGDLNVQYVIDVRDFTTEEITSLLAPIDYNENKLLVGHNLKFEAKHLKHNYGINFHTIHDTMLCEMCLFNGLSRRYGLADLAVFYLGVEKHKEASLFEYEFTKKKPVTMDDRLLEESDIFITPFELDDAIKIDKSTRLQFINIADRPFTKTQILYGADDIIYPILIRERQLLGRVVEESNMVHKPTSWMKIENFYCLVLADMELNGMPISQEMWRELHDKNYEVWLSRKSNLDRWVTENYPQYSVGNNDLFTNQPVCTIQWSSGKQVVDLFKRLDICPRAYSKQTKRVEFTVGADTLLKTLPNNLKIAYEKTIEHPITDLDTLKLAYLLYKKSEQAITTFGKEWLKYVHPITKRCHSNYRQILNTSRISSTSPNLNNISGGAWRDCFVCEEDEYIVNLDYANQEVRRAAEVAGDELLMNFFVVGDDYFGDDFHSFTASKVYSVLENDTTLIIPPKEIIVDGAPQSNPEFTKDHAGKRTNAKTTTFGLFYGSTAHTFKDKFGITLEEAEDLINGYMEAFPGLEAHFQRCETNAKTKSYIDIYGPFGVRWFCPFFKDIDRLMKEALDAFPEGYSRLSTKDRISAKKILYEEKPWVKGLFQQAGRLRNSLVNKNKNFPIQGSCSIMMKIAMNIFRKYYVENNKNFKLIGNIYDEVLCIVKKEEGEEAGEKLKYAMEKAGTIVSPKVPQKANYVLSHTWEH